MTCKDCFHYEVCKTYEEFDFANHSKCDTYKDKSKIVEPPCKVEDTVYFVSENILEIAKGKIKEIIINKHNNKIMNVDFGYMCKQFDIEYVGKTVFLTKEEAEAMLKELQNDVK